MHEMIISEHHRRRTVARRMARLAAERAAAIVAPPIVITRREPAIAVPRAVEPIEEQMPSVPPRAPRLGEIDGAVNV